MQVKRRLSRGDSDDGDRSETRSPRFPSSKRARLASSVASRPPSYDAISALPSELLARIFSYLSETTLLELSTVSRLFHRVATDGHLWRAHYYRRFILPRAHLIPGFRRGSSGRNEVATGWTSSITGIKGGRIGRKEKKENSPGDSVDWKKSYKLLHNWARGRCDVEELHFHPQERFAPGKTVVKVVEGLTITADSASGLLVWDLRTRAPIAQARLESYKNQQVRPLSMAVYDEQLSHGQLGVAVGFEDGTFGVWSMHLESGELVEICRHDVEGYGGLEAVAYCHPYVLVASKSGFITLWTFDHPSVQPRLSPGQLAPSQPQEETAQTETPSPDVIPAYNKTMKLSTFAGLPRIPVLLRSLQSQSTRQPLTLSMRKVTALPSHTSSTIASIVYTLDTINGWCIAIQELDIHPNEFDPVPTIIDSRLAYTPPSSTRGSAPSSPIRHSGSSRQSESWGEDEFTDGPIGLCYSHPYLLATLPDNTLLLHTCKTKPHSLSISPGTRLWGHTSGISDAEITTRGKAVSVSARGDEIRVWELEGRIGGSVEVRPRQQEQDESALIKMPALDFKKNKVGFDDEMVIVLQEGHDGRESLMVYDFT
ncbi:unnamed protein product [Clonostachys rosea]|uniref:F-box domain-containing protein n=1 Tax=Bionectria ochroleuca TaxID=29856 RepID=A0ABY6UTH7_BIOOC|nr:unnamed protein product [Clonostachys rosea]